MRADGQEWRAASNPPPCGCCSAYSVREMDSAHDAALIADSPSTLSGAAAAMGRRGGAAGTGKAKTRSREQYQEMARRSALARRKVE